MSDNNNNLFDKIKKYKKIAKVIGLISPVILPFLMVILFVAMSLYTVYIAYNQVGVVIEGTERLGNLVTMQGWGTNKEVFFGKLKTEYALYHANPDRSDELDIALLAATIHYGKLIDPNVWEDDNPGAFGNTSTPTSSIIDTLKTGSFYSWAESELGNSKSLIIGDRGLVGALISYHTSVSCKSAGGILESIFNSVKSRIYSLFMTSQSVSELVWGGVFTGYFDYMNVTGNGVGSYINQMISKNYQGLKNSAYDVKNIFDTSKVEKDFSCEWNEIPFATFEAYNDYGKYKEYLRNYFIREYYIDCEKCQYKDYTEEGKTAKTEQIIEEIFNQRNDFKKLFNITGDVIEDTQYIPGMASLPLPPPSGGRYHYTSYFLEKRTYVVDGRTITDTHTGLDFPQSVGTPVYAMADGDVILSGWHYPNNPRKGYGQYVKLGHDLDGDGKYDYYTLYAHLSVRNVLSGNKIGGGQKIGEVGNTGNSTGPHLHLEVRNSRDQIMDPLPIIEGMLRNDKTIFDKADNNKE